MTKNNYYEFNPDYAIPPGFSLLETIEGLGMTQAELAERTNRPKKTINEIIKGKSAITPETALQLERVLGVPAAFWNNLERNYREKLAEIEEHERLVRSLDWLKHIPIKEMTKYGWIKKYVDKVDQLKEVLNFFGVASLEAWEKIWSGNLSDPKIAYRRSLAFENDTNATAAWIRKGEIEAHKIKCLPYDHLKFKDTLNYIRGLTRLEAEEFVQEIQSKCAEAGVAVVFVPELPKCRANGATYWISPNKAVLQLSLRYKSDDHLWFTFFHEAGHVLQTKKKEIFLEYTMGANDKEDQANKFASDFLIPQKDFTQFLITNDFRVSAIIQFAENIGIAPGIVVGRLQFEGKVSYKSNLNKLKRRFRWAFE